ncbi:MAG: FAD-dependent oxidoreductase, partial [Methylomonas sp.]|nr:FAD-dependent oxidoreductase [Methylomonas sp.]
AGSLLAWEMMRRQLRVLVIDDGDLNASQVAAGLINPVTGQRLVKVVDIEQLLPAAISCYRSLSLMFNRQFFVSLPMLRILKNAAEQDIARRRLTESAYQTFLRAHPYSVDRIISPHGLLEQLQAGFVNTRPLLDSLRDHFIANGSYRQVRLDYTELLLQPRPKWREVQPLHVVFCEGYRGVANPWFGNLPFQPAKGEILSCTADSVCPRRILNFGHWLIPTGENDFRIGATFESGKTDRQPTPQARQRLLQALSVACPKISVADVSAHQAGVRPATLDKQPFIGTHPSYSNLHIFNGFGAKGSLSIPWHASCFVDALTQKTPLPAHCDIRRYDQTFFPV